MTCWAVWINVVLIVTSVVQDTRSSAPPGDQTVLRQAKAAALQIDSAYQRGLVLDEIGAAEAKGGDLDSAQDSAVRAYPHTMGTLTAIGEQLSKTSDSSRVHAITAKLPGDSASTVFAIIAQEEARNGDTAQALRTTDQIKAPEVRSDVLRWIAEQQATGGDYSGARKTLNSAMAVDQRRTGTADDIEVMIAEGQVAHGDIKAAHATLSSLTSTRTRSAAMILAANLLAEKGDTGDARTLLEEALRSLPEGAEYEFLRYLAIPTEIKVGLKERAMHDATLLSSGMRLKAYSSAAVTFAEARDIGSLNGALQKMAAAAASAGRENQMSELLLTLNVTAALIDVGEIGEASRLIASLPARSDEISRTPIESEIQLQNVIILAKKGEFGKARSLALRIRPDSVADTQRGTALRSVALLETKEKGSVSAQVWATALADPEDRAYALLGIAEAMLGIETVRLPYQPVVQVADFRQSG